MLKGIVSVYRFVWREGNIAVDLKMDLEKPSHQKQSETLQQALSVLKDHKKWMSQKKGSVAPSQSQQTAARKNFSGRY